MPGKSKYNFLQVLCNKKPKKNKLKARRLTEHIRLQNALEHGKQCLFKRAHRVWIRFAHQSETESSM